MDGLADGDTDALSEGLRLALGDWDGEILCDIDGEIDGDKELLKLGEIEALIDGDRDGDSLDAWLGLKEGDKLEEILGEKLADGD